MPLRPYRSLLLAAALATLGLAGAARAHEDGEILARREGAALVGWRAPTSSIDPVEVRLLGINDLHGQLEIRARADSSAGSRPMGGAAVLAAYLASERDENPRRTLTLIAGDSIGASPLVSAYLHDQPTLAALNELIAGDCPRLTRDWATRPSPVVTRCRVVATVGNHEFDHGTAELERLLYGGKAADGRGGDWSGMRIPVLAANVVRRDGQAPFLPPAAIVELDGVRIGVIGAVTSETPSLVTAGRIPDLSFLAEAGPINAAVAALRGRGVHAIVLLIHEGLIAPATPEPAPLALREARGRLAQLLAGIDGGIDVVVAGHTHKLNNLLLPLRDGSLTLVVQARSDGTAYSAIDLTIDRPSGAVVAKSARVLTAWADGGPGHQPVRSIARLVAAAAKQTAPVAARLVGTAAAAIRRGDPAQPDSPLGNLVADAQRAAAGTEFAFMNAAGLRHDLEAGPVSYGALFDVQPFGNVLMRLTLTGEQVLRLLEQQWSGPHAMAPRFLRVAGLRYAYDLGRPAGQRIVAADDAEGLPLDPARHYSVVANDFLTGGGDYYTVLAEATDATPLMPDIDALEAYVRAARTPLEPGLDGRVRDATRR